MSEWTVVIICLLIGFIFGFGVWTRLKYIFRDEDKSK